jgi:hypothetical protein
MNIFEILGEFLAYFGPSSADNDRSIVGESPMEREISRFWRRVGLMLLLGMSIAALYVWLIRPRLAPSTSRQAAPSSAAETR